MKGTNAGGVQPIPSGQALEALCAWSDNPSHSSNVSLKLQLRSKAALTIFKLCYARGTERSADGRAGRIRQSIPLAALVGESNMG